MTLKIDRNNCVRCGACERLCPGCFKLNEEGIAEVLKNRAEAGLEEAIYACPTGAIEKI